jgi:hypothetical protein
MMRHAGIIILEILLWLSAAGCSGGWPEYRDPSGFKIQSPPDWKVETVDQRWVWAHSPDKSTFTLIYPFLAPQPATAERCIQEVSKLLSSALPNAHVESEKQQSTQPDEVTAVISYQTPQDKPGSAIGGVVSSITDGSGGSGHAAALCSVYGRSGIFYVIAAPKDQFQSQRDSLVKVLKSFSFTPPEKPKTKPAPDAGISYVRWQDPAEAAFSVEIPSGWLVQGGLTRGGPVDVRQSISLTAPDSLIRVTVGDGNLPPFSSPSMSMIASGLWPGTWYDPGYGNKMMVKYYVGGKDLGKEYVAQTVSKWCAGIQITAANDRPDASQAINQTYQQSATYGITSQLNTGEVAFTCTMNGQPMQGYYFIGTTITGDSSNILDPSGVWYVQYLFGYVAPQDRIELAEAVIGRIAKSYQVSPAWAQAQQGITSASSQIVSQTGNQISQIMNDSYWTRQNAQSDVYRNWSNATLGQTDVKDEQTGETWKVASGHNYYWRQDNAFGNPGAVVGTDQYQRPDIDFSPLLGY